MKVIKVGATWCKGCKIMGPTWKEIEKEQPWLETEYISVDENPETMNEYKILSLPCFIFLDENGEEFLRLSGEMEKEKLIEIVLENRDR